MRSKKVLVLATYPIKNPQHGGQKRLDAVVAMYKRQFSDVRFTSVFYKKTYKDYGPGDISLGITSSLDAEKHPLTGDIICGRAIFHDKKVKTAVSKLLTTFKPAIIHIEQPYIYLGLRPLLKELGINPKLVFGSQNIEGPMKQVILEGAGVSPAETKAAVETINDVEIQLSKECDILTACTEDDLNKHRKMGAKNVILSQNGISPVSTSHSDIKYWNKIFRDKGIKTKILFVASAHPPSITGFIDMVGKGMGFLPRDSKMLMAGSVCDYFVEHIKSSKVDIQDATFWLRAHPCGRLSEGRLGALLKLADIIILPITEGGGSNLKTAEAILANKKIVTTTHALRSFEWLIDLPNVWVADKQTDFKESIRQAIDTTFIPRTQKQNALVKTVLWEHRLKDLEKKVGLL